MPVQIGVLEGLIRFRNEATADLNRFVAHLAEAGKKAQRLGQGLSDVGSKLTQTLTVPLLAVSGYAIKAASDFESSFAGVIKTVDGLQDHLGNLTTEGLQLQNQLRSLAKERPIDVNQLNAVAEAAGQLGIAREDILSFTKVMTDMQVSTNLSADEAATSLAQFQNIFGAIGKETSNLGSTIVALGNAGASTERQIVEMGLRIAGAGKQIGLTQGEVLAIANTLASVGIEVEAGGSAISKVLIDMSLAVVNGGRELSNFAAVAKMSSEEFQTAFRDNAAGALDAFIKGLADLGGEQALRVLDQMEIKEVRMRDALLRASGAGDLLKQSLDLQSRAWQENNALTSEAEKRYKTFDSQIKIIWNRIKDTAITVGTALLPVLKDFLNLLQPLIDRLSQFATWFAELPQPVRQVSLVITALLAAAGPLLVIIGSLVTAWGSVATAMPAVVAGLTKALAVITGPAGWIAAGTLLLLSIKPVREEIVKLGQQIYSSLVSAIDTIRKSFSSWNVDLSYLKDEIKRLTSTIGKDLLTVLAGLVKAIVLVIDFQARMIGQVVTAIERFLSWANSIKEVRLILEGLVVWMERLYKIGRMVSGLHLFDMLSQGQASQSSPQPFKFEPLGLQSGKKQVDDLTSSLKGLSDQAANSGVDILGKDAEEATDNVARLKAEMAEQLRYLKELGDLAAKGPGLDTASRLKQEQRINDEHEYRLDLLQKQEQFGKVVGKELADAAKKLREFDREVQTKLKVSLDLEPIDLSNLKDLNDQLNSVSMQRLIDELTAIDAVVRRNEEAFQSTFDAYDQFYDTLTEDVRQGFKTARERLEEYKNQVIEAHTRGGASALSAAEMEKELARIREESLLQSLDDWQTFFGFLGGMFGGFAQQIANSLQAIQSAYQTGKKLDASGFGGQMAGAWGGALATVAAIYEIYQAVSKSIKRDKARTWGEVTSLSVTDGQMSSPSYFDNRGGREISSTLRSMLQDLIDALGAVLKDLPQIVIRARKDGKEFSTYVAGVWVGTFRDAQTALEEGIASAITQADFSAISQEFRIALQKSIGRTLDEIEANIETARAVRGARIGSAGSQYLDISEQRQREIAAAQRLGLATEDLIRTRNEELRALINNALGIDTTASDILRDLGSLNRGMSEAGENYAAQIQQMIDQTMAQITAMETRGGSGPRNLNPLSGEESPSVSDTAQSEWDRALAELRKQLSIYIEELNKIPRALSEQEIDLGIWNALSRYLEGIPKYAKESVKFAKMKVDIEFQQIKMQLIALGKWEEWSQAFNDAYNAAMAAAGKKPGGGRGGAGSGDRQSARDFVQDRRFELGLTGMSDYQRSIAELNRQYDELFKQAGKDKKLRQELMDLKERELALLEQEKRKTTVQNFQSFMGIGTDQFSQVRKTAADLIKQIEESPFGDARKASMIGRVMAEVDRQITEMTQTAAVGVFGRLISDLEAAGLKDTELSSARKAMALLEHTLKVENYRREIELIRAQGKLTVEQMKAIDDAFDIFKGLDPLNGIDGGKYDKSRNRELMRNRAAEAAQALADALSKARDALKKYQGEGLDPLRQRIVEIVSDFRNIRKMLGDTPEVMETYARAVNRAIQEFLDPIRDVQRDLFYGESSVVDVLGQWQNIQGEFVDLQNRFRAGDLSVVDTIPDFIQQLLSTAQQVVPIGSQAYKEIFVNANKFLNEVLALKPEDLGTVDNPMTVQGVADLAILSEAQLTALDKLYKSSDRIAVALDRIESNTRYSGGLNRVA